MSTVSNTFHLYSKIFSLNPKCRQNPLFSEEAAFQFNYCPINQCILHSNGQSPLQFHQIELHNDDDREIENAYNNIDAILLNLTMNDIRHKW